MYKRDTFCCFDIYEDVVNGEYVVFKKGSTIDELFRGDKEDTYEYVLENKPERKTIERINGRMKKRPKDIDKFVERVVNELCDEYPDIDLFDLCYAFQAQFMFQLSLRMVKESKPDA